MLEHFLMSILPKTMTMIWNKLKHKKPSPYQTGYWDGKRTDELLVCDKNKKYHVVRMYEGILDGEHFMNFYDNNDYEIDNVEFWIEIDNPF